MMQLEEFRYWFDQNFTAYIEKRTQRYSVFISKGAIFESIEHVKTLAMEGKRVRPYLVYLGYVAEGGASLEEITDVLFAVELFHMFCLIHDDIIDEDEMRRGVTTIHALVREKNEHLGRPELAVRAGNSQAMLVGDLVFAWVFELLASKMANPVFAKEFLYTVDEVVVGQMIDVDLMTQSNATRQSILDKMRLKTAGYTFVQPVRLGRILAGKVDHDAKVDALGLALGLGFQMQDDLLDIYGVESEMGKDIGSDIEECQHTLLTQYVVDHGQAADIAEFNLLMGKPINSDLLKATRDLFDRTGASDALRGDIIEQIGIARTLVQELSWPKDAQSSLKKLIEYVASRTS